MDLFSPVDLGDLHLPNRVVMAPLTRLRSGDAGVPDDLVAEHYAQRASTGLIVTEGTYPVPGSRGYPGQPGIVTDAQVAGWARVADRVHAAGGRLVMQLMHAGRVSHPEVAEADHVVAPSAIAIQGDVRTATGKQPYPVPHALTEDEISGPDGVIAGFAAAARRAREAGLDGVEVHSANGYLLHEFLAPGSNTRTDAWGGSPQARARLTIEVTRAVAAEVGAGRTGVRISPAHDIQDAWERDAADVAATYGALADALAPLGLAYVSVLHADPTSDLVQEVRRRAGAPFVVNSGFASVTGRRDAVDLVDAAHADAVAVGRALIANPDLVERWAGDHPVNEPDASTFYTPGAKGYTDYPRLSA